MATAPSGLPADYAERVYAGILGKIIGVYLGRPFEGWSYERISRELGEVDFYVNDRLQRPLVVADDDISGTLTFVRAVADFGYDPDLTPAQIGQTWLNYLVEQKTVLWWGGLGNSTEHTAYLRLKRGIPAPLSGAIATNGKVVAEQIGAQIFIDGWAMLCPGDPERAADFARRAGRVSHDGEAVFAAQVIAAMEALAFVESDIDRLTDEALRFIPRDAILYRLILDVRSWKRQDGDWRRTRERIDERYGYHRYGGNCHVLPNHALIHLGLQYGENDFGRALMITNTSGWDTDCNSGNLGCLFGIRGGLGVFAGDRDWRGPVADRILISSADGGRAITDAAIEAGYLVEAAHRLRGLDAPAPKGGARYHFSFPGSVQGWRSSAIPGPDAGEAPVIRIENVAGHSAAGDRSLAVRVERFGADHHARVATATFVPPEALAASGYHLEASPSLYGGQTIRARVTAGADFPAGGTVALYVGRYGAGELPAPSRELLVGPGKPLAPGEPTLLEWTLPPGDGRPIFQVGLEIGSAGQSERSGGAVYLDWLDWSGSPRVAWGAPAGALPASRRAWVDALSLMTGRQGSMYTLIANEGRGMAITGRRDWANYTVGATLRPHMAAAIGLAGYVQGLERYYALVLHEHGALRLLKRGPGAAASTAEVVLAERPERWELDRPYRFELQFRAGTINARLDGDLAFSVTDVDQPLAEGAIGLLVAAGRADVDEVEVG
jgi:ADP-ribosylglycohydrolase